MAAVADPARNTMRILHLTPDYHPAMGGGEWYVRQISERLAARGHDVTVVTANSRGIRGAGGKPLAPSEMMNGVKVVRLNRTYALHERVLRTRGVYRALALVGDPRVQMLATSPYSIRAFVATLLSRADVVGVANWYHGSLAYQTCVARRLQRFRLVGIPFTHTERPWARSPLFSQMLEQCDAVVAMTEHEKRFIESRSSQGNAHVVGAGVDPAHFAVRDGARIRAAHAIASDAPLVGYVGRMSATKGVVTLIQAMQVVWSRNPSVRLLLAGSGLPASGGGDPTVHATFATLSPAEQSRIIYIPSMSEPDKASVFDALDLFAMVSTAESFGMAYLEAWMCGKPVIGGAIGSTACVVRDGIDGRLVRPDDSRALADCIARLLADEPIRKRMGEAGRVRAQSSFTWDRITDGVEQVYSSPPSTRQRSHKAAEATAGHAGDAEDAPVELPEHAVPNAKTGVL